MVFGILKDIKEGENRVIRTPATTTRSNNFIKL